MIELITLLVLVRCESFHFPGYFLIGSKEVMESIPKQRGHGDHGVYDKGCSMLRVIIHDEYLVNKDHGVPSE